MFSQVANNSDVIFVAVKPQHVSGVLKELRPVLKPNHTIVSIAAGITLETCVGVPGEVNFYIYKYFFTTAIENCHTIK